LDTRSDLNLIKINKLKGDTPVNEQNKIYLKGINEKIVLTLGHVKIKLIINKKELETEFTVVNAQFPVPRDGILGHTFLIKNNAIIDVANNTLTIKDDSNLNDNEICFTLEPRSETVVEIPIAEKSMENKPIMINKQELATGVYCVNIVNTVKDEKIIISVLNI